MFSNLTVQEKCRTLNNKDAPLNGGLVCHWYKKANSVQCKGICKPQRVLKVKVSDYVECGPNTNYTWSLKNIIPECTGKKN